MMTDTVANPVGKRLQRARRTAGRSRGDLARTLGISEESLRSYETGRRTPADLLPALGDTLHVDIAWLVGVPGASRESVASILATIVQLLERVEERVGALRRLLEVSGQGSGARELGSRWGGPPGG
jgi:predicted transcriptional regulator